MRASWRAWGSSPSRTCILTLYPSVTNHSEREHVRNQRLQNRQGGNLESRLSRQPHDGAIYSRVALYYRDRPKESHHASYPTHGEVGALETEAVTGQSSYGLRGGRQRCRSHHA